MVKAIEDMTPAEKHAYAVLDCFTNTYWPTDLKVMSTQFVYVAKADGKKVATVYGIEPVKYDTAHLFAAAPDLFAACAAARKALPAIRAMLEPIEEGVADSVLPILRQIETAMLKARGSPVPNPDVEVKNAYDTSGFSAVMDVVADEESGL